MENCEFQKLGVISMANDNLNGDSPSCDGDVKSFLLELEDRNVLLQECAALHPSTAFAASIASVKSWLSLWDKALDFGPFRIALLQGTFWIITKPIFGTSLCPLCDASSLPELYIDHFTRL